MSDIRRIASSWLVHLSSDDATDEDYQQFNKWLKADPLHEEVYREAETLFSEFTELKYLGEERPLATSPASTRDQLVAVKDTAPLQRSRTTWRLEPGVSAIAASLIVAIVVGWTLFADRISSSPQRHETSLAEIRDVMLADGSLVTLSASTAIDVTIDNSQRSVALRSGQAFFEVAHDATLPFTVTAGETSVYVLGTKFDVRIGPEAVGVSVLEGRVRVSTASESRLPVTDEYMGDNAYVLTAGQKISAPVSGERMLVQPVAMEKPGAWRDGMLVYENAKLLDLAADVNRYYSGGIEVSGDATSELRVTAVFRPSQIEQMLQTLTRAYSLEVRHEDDGRIVIGPVISQQ